MNAIPLRLTNNRNGESVFFENSGNATVGEIWRIDISVAGDNDHVHFFPTTPFDFCCRHREARVALKLGTSLASIIIKKVDWGAVFAYHFNPFGS